LAEANGNDDSLDFRITLILAAPRQLKQLRTKAGRTMVACGWLGHRNFCRSKGQERAQQGKRFQPVVLPGLQGKGQCAAKKPFC
jgi:hypothetical protein